jgi:hypothetical protein
MSNPLLNRRQITSQREQRANALPPEVMQALANQPSPVDLTNVEDVLKQILHETVSKTEVAVLDYAPAQLVLDRFPIPGSQRALIRRTGTGNCTAALAVVAAPTPTKVASANESRFGGYIVNYGANAIILYLCDIGMVGQTGVPAIYLPVNGSWNFQLSDIVWCGSVHALPAAGTSTVSVAEI